MITAPSSSHHCTRPGWLFAGCHYISFQVFSVVFLLKGSARGRTVDVDDDSAGDGNVRLHRHFAALWSSSDCSREAVVKIVLSKTKSKSKSKSKSQLVSCWERHRRRKRWFDNVDKRRVIKRKVVNRNIKSVWQNGLISTRHKQTRKNNGDILNLKRTPSPR